MITTALFCLVLSVNACGGGGSGDSDITVTTDRVTTDENSSYTVGGSISGLDGKIRLIKRTDQSEETLELTTNGNFTFSGKILDGTTYEIDIDSWPSGQKCLARNAFGTIKSANIDSISINCVNLNAIATLSGELTAAASIATDSDVNDLFAPYQDNSDFDTAQPISNIVTLHGFASNEGTGTIGQNDRFAFSSDEFDVFKVSLQAGQLIQLQIIDFDEFNFETAYEGDLDLYIADNEGNLVAYSESTHEFEEVVVSEAGEYYIVIFAYSGISKYILRLAPPCICETTRRANMAHVDFVPDEMIVKFKNNQIRSLAAAGNQNLAFTFSHQNTSRPTLAKIERSPLKASMQGTQTTPLPALKTLNSEGYRKLMTLLDIKALSQHPNTEYAEPNYILKSYAIPNDEYYNYQWHYPLINLPQAWDLSTGIQENNPVIVAVIDTGVFLDHPDFAGQLVSGYDFISSPAFSMDGDGIDSNPDDPGDSLDRGKSSFHGTHVAGTVAALSNEGAGVAGVSWGAKIMPVRVLGYGGGTDYDIQQGMRYAAQLPNDSGTIPSRKADIINMSLGGGLGSISDQETINAIRDAGVIIVAAAGNDDTSAPSYPASYRGVISVSAVDMNTTKAPYSNYGEFIDVAAPGGNTSVDLNGDGYSDGILSPIADDTNGSRQPSWKFDQGTSMASPHVAGVIALMKAVYPGLTPNDVDALLQDGALTNDLGDSGWDQYYGHGLIDAYKAVQAARQLANGGEPPPESPPNVTASPYSIAFGASASTKVNIINQGGGSPSITAFEESANWLSVTASEVDDNGLGTYQLQVDRTGLEGGYYQTKISFTLSNGSLLVVPVTMQVGVTDNTGELTQQYVLLIDANSEAQTVIQTVLAQNEGERYTYRFEQVPVGDYYVFSGSDIDNDLLVCQSGESCGAYPILSNIQPISVLGGMIDNLNIVVDILGGLSSSTQSVDGASSRPGIRRNPLETRKQLAE